VHENLNLNIFVLFSSNKHSQKKSICFFSSFFTFKFQNENYIIYRKIVRTQFHSLFIHVSGTMGGRGCLQKIIKLVNFKISLKYYWDRMEE
jgi:hypothetical protein